METLKSHDRRKREGWFEKYTKSHLSGIDIGCGHDPLNESFIKYDRMLGSGDAQTMDDQPDNYFHTVYASHVLEHMHDPMKAILNWYRILAPNGHLIICVPHRDLYEKKTTLPSRWNGDHKTFWLPDRTEPPVTLSLNDCVKETICRFAKAEIVSLRVLDENYVSNGPDKHSSGEFSIEIIIKKPNLLFDEQYYLENNTDVARSIQAGWPKTGYAHYLEHGEHEDRKFAWKIPKPKNLSQKPNLLIPNVPSLIGDFLGITPALIEFSKNYNVFVDTKDEIDGLVELLKPHGINKKTNDEVMDKVITVDLSAAFVKAHESGWYMTQALMHNVGLPVVSPPPKAKLFFLSNSGVQCYDYLISPFSRCLPTEERWSQANWQKLVNLCPNNTFGLLGNSKHDDKNFVVGKNVYPVFDLPFSALCELFSKHQLLISVVTGTSHLAFHLGVKNIVLTTQNGQWGVNPDAFCIKKELRTITAEEVIAWINNIKAS
jgi:SAM-dependent methyltransferase